MRVFGEKYPIIFEIIIFVIGSLLAIFVAGAFKVCGFDNEISISAARILIGVALLAVFHKCFAFGNSFKGFVLMLPALLLAIYKIPYHFISGGGTPNRITIPVLLIGLAPAVFEEIIFRGIFISKLKKKFNSPTAIVLISAIVFSLAHLINMSSMTTLSLFLQLIMALVSGIVFGAIYLYTGDLVSIIAAHFAVDVLGGIFCGGEKTVNYFYIILAVLWILETVYGFLIVKKITAEKEQ